MIKIRYAKESDLNLVLACWIKDCRWDFKDIPSWQFYQSFSPEINALVKKCLIAVACNPEDEDHVYGFIAFDKVDGAIILHYAYTKSKFRKFGIMQSLIREHFPEYGDLPLAITYKNEKSKHIIEKMRAIYRPDLKKKLLGG